MVFAIWGRDGMGKSTLADALGRIFCKQGITAIIDTDLTQPTLPARINGKKLSAETSLGKAISGMGADDAARYLHQHPKVKQLFYAGLTSQDEYLSFELGLDDTDAARDFMERCAVLGDTVFLDLSGQRTDPFVPAALSGADKIIIPITPNVQGVCWFNAVKPFLEAMNASGRVLPVAAMADRQHDLCAVEKTADMRFIAALPYVREFRQDGADAGTTPAATRYAKQVQKIFGMLREVKA
jgi:MinD-like ATPase involved in chromosome partitioning or flagellar assembly